MDNFKGLERRRFVRIPFWFINKYRVYPYTVSDFRKGLGKDIGVGGICFEGDTDFAVGTNLEVEIDMPVLDHAVRAVCRLVWIRPQSNNQKFVYGLSFIDIDERNLAAVKKVIDSFSK